MIGTGATMAEAQADFLWTQDRRPADGPADARPGPTRLGRLAGFGVITLAILAFEVTADPALSTIVGCLKFGWDKARLAWWLGRADPDRRRGRICSLFYLAWGLWKVSMVATAAAFALAFAAVVVDHGIGKPRGVGGPPPGFFHAFLLALSGFFCSSIVSSVAVVSALRHRVKVWVGPEAGWALEDRRWPPQAARRRHPTANRARPIVLSALITALLVGLVAVLLPLSSTRFDIKTPAAVAVFLAAEVSVLVGAPFALLSLLETLGHRVIARSPEACWAEAEDVAHRGA